MSYKNLLKQQIEALEKEIQQAQGDKQMLEAQLQKLKISEFEEDLAESAPQTLLKG